uniref:Ig-like domain-containing protein n=1 Tax=Dicentrarchus labrax TaxID=13489 RepID=A0A8P4K2M2_DICLA
MHYNMRHINLSRCLLIKSFVKGVQGQTKRICALKGSSVNLPCSAEHPTSSMKWYTAHWNGSTLVQNELSVDGNRVMYKPEENHPTLTINDLRESDANFYCCRENTDQPQLCRYSVIQLSVSGKLTVKLFFCVLTRVSEFLFNN